MNETHIQKIGEELKLATTQIQAVARLLEEGATIPFIARYRKEATGSLRRGGHYRHQGPPEPACRTR